jgi:hypothetical protein
VRSIITKDVTVSVSLSKTFTVNIDAQSLGKEKDEDGFIVDDVFITRDDIDEAVYDQVVLPQNLSSFVKSMFRYDLDLKAAKMPKYLADALEDCSEWNLDEMTIIPEFPVNETY